MLDETSFWTGASGRRYVYYVYEGIPDVAAKLGNYIYTKRLNNNQWIPIYFGEGDLLRRCDENTSLMACIQAKGATHVHLRQNPDRASRQAERTDLLAEFNNAFAPAGCHERDQAIHTWTGGSGQDYIYYVYAARECMPQRQGIFIYAVRGDGDDWVPLYMGEGDIAVRLEPDVARMERVMQAGCTHVHIRLTIDPELREFELRDLLQQFAPVLRQQGCQPDDMLPEAGPAQS